MARRCARLNGYSAFIAKVRECERELGDKTEAMKAAVRYCREHDILKEFLEANGTEVMNMLLTEWNMEDALAVRFEEGMEKGIEEGWSKGRIEIARNALIQGMPLEIISAITGLELAAIKELAAHQ
jgi:predicted transposase/invertase (TIGR01784 family)